MRRIAALIALAALALPMAACKSKVEKAYDRCVEKQTRKLQEQAERGPASLKESIADDLPKLAEAACGPIRSMCASNDEAAICTQTIEMLAGKDDSE